MNDFNVEEETIDQEQKEDVLEYEGLLCKHVLDEWSKGQQFCSQLNDLYDTLYAMIRGE